MTRPATEFERVHATALALGGKAALIRGPSGAGKSDLALRCIAAPALAHVPHRAELVADDQVELRRTFDGIEVSAPPAIAGKLEVRGLGVLEVPYRASARLALVIDLVALDDVPRFPLEEIATVFLGQAVPTLRLAPFEASAPAKVVLALAAARDVLAPPRSVG
ncbi:aldolase [Hyphomicrobium nitrativorans NL23]|uniref:Aldolase n=1 Tax=Hyphomicrobium nitrativorans NL23 TaxID=1029756 RepID=V5SB51_9HYPH|nr:HPr kinase/phosphatase C-terminal domain-containing protein [Hyphomicrobium nitrativorans]AHB47149.1 aldolase [Hyphomicrobium nitrativorans NL23]